MPVYHPHKDENGKLVVLAKPSTPTAEGAWHGADHHATTVPASPMPECVNGIAVTPWTDAPATEAGWQALVAGCTFDEPPFEAPLGKKPASGVVVVEPDGRVWVVSPSNQFGGYANTFPKGRVARADHASLRANAVREAHEESGLKVALTGFLVDVPRSTTFTRYYVGRRVGGCPSAMGWESQAVHLVPAALLPSIAAHKNDVPILAALDAHSASQVPVEAEAQGQRFCQPTAAGSAQAPPGAKNQPHVGLTDPNRTYLGSAEPVRVLVADFATAVMAAYDQFLQGKAPAAVVQPQIDALIKQAGDRLMGRDPAYEIAPWQGERLRGKFLAALPNMKGADDPGEALFKHLALQCIKGAQALANGLD